MRAIAILLIVGVFARHDTAFRISEATGWSPGGVFYVSGALWEMLLCALLLFCIWDARAGVWRNLGIVATLIGIVEAAMMAGCQMAVQGRPPPNTTTCDYVTGLPIFWWTLATELVAVAIVVARGVDHD